jgi:PAS domain S-box-containing protein
MNREPKLYNSLFDLYPDPVFIFDKKTNSLAHFNKSAYKALGYTKEEFSRLDINDIFFIELGNNGNDYILNVLSGANKGSNGILQIRKDGSLIPVDIKTCNIQHNGTEYCMFVSRDTSDRINLEKSLIKSVSDFINLVENSPVGVYKTTLSGKMLYVNPALSSMLGYKSPGEIDSDGIMSIYKRKGDRDRLINILKKEGRSINFEVDLINKKGETITALLSAVLEDDEISGTIMDISDRKAAEQSICQAKNLWEDSFNSITDMITIHDDNFNIIKANRAAERILNLPELNSKTVKCFKHYHGTDGPPEKCMSCQCITTGESVNVEFFEPHLDMYVEIRAIPRLNAEGKLSGVIHIVRDISKRKTVEEMLIKSRQEIKEHARKLSESNTALKVFLRQRNDDRIESEEKILSNMKTLIHPYIQKIKLLDAEADISHYIGMLENNLQNITSGFSAKLLSKSYGLTPKELQIASMIKEGKQSKDIAKLLRLSIETINCHRNSIRKKLGLKNKKINLRSHLKTIFD